MKQRVLVTGGAGYVGSVCSEELLRQGYEVTIVDDLSTGHRRAVPQGAEFFEMDIGDAAGIRKVLAAKSFDAVFHFAAKALIPESVTNPALFYQVNVVAATTLIDAVRDAGLDCSREDLFRCGVILGSGIGGLEEIEKDLELRAGAVKRLSMSSPWRHLIPHRDPRSSRFDARFRAGGLGARRWYDFRNSGGG